MWNTCTALDSTVMHGTVISADGHRGAPGRRLRAGRDI
jgi:hypothetical protein